ncbi:MAG: hypothetical protein E4H28_02185 [Gemmatimonadales bacterium]|nr:MAG: hypothetical protein E4H28_02185 [Gemmatimonadales bacterium]
MTLGQRLSEWLGIRENEVGIVAVSFAGAFLVMSFVGLSATLRETTYQAEIGTSNLSYVRAGVVFLGISAAVLFSRTLGLVEPRRAMRVIALLLATGMAAIWPFLGSSKTAVVLFYLVTATGTVLLASGFWLVVSEMLVVREAKRLFGLISAGGTLGLLVTGLAGALIAKQVETATFVPALVVILIAYAGLNEFVPRTRISCTPIAPNVRWNDSIALIFSRPHLRTLTAIVFLAAVISMLIDYQFRQAAAQVFLPDKQALQSFYLLFLAGTGAVALAIQLLVTTRVMTRAGVTWSLAVLPLFVLALSAGMLILPGLPLASGLRGADSTLRKSLFRSGVEFLWVPVHPDTRRKVKTFVDTMANNLGDGLATLMFFLIVTKGGMSSLYLSPLVIGAGLVFLALARKMGLEYTATLRRRLADGDSGDLLAEAQDGLTLGPVTLNRIDLTRILSTLALDPDDSTAVRSAAAVEVAPVANAIDPLDPQAIFASTDDEMVRAWLGRGEPLSVDSIPDLARLLARDRIRDATARRLIAIGEPAGPPLCLILQDNSADFVVRRRIAGVLGAIPGEAAFNGLIGALSADRFEVRYRAARSLSRRRAEADARLEEATVWEAIRSELSRGRAVWELARLLDHDDPNLPVEQRVTQRGQLSLEHVFRLLSFVLDAEAIYATWAGITGDNANLESLALEYLEQVLPKDVRDRLWPFIGDLSAEQSRRAIRPLDDVIEDLMDTGATLFGGDHRQALARYLDKSNADGLPESVDTSD